MIVVTSRFRVANGMEDTVREAFVHRPGMVDHAPGFLGMEVFTAIDDATVFYLVTRWTDEAAYKAWHDGGGKKSSLPFIPKGLKLDPEYTRLEWIERIDPKDGQPSANAQIRDLAPLLAGFLADANAVFYLAAAPDGSVIAVNRAFERALNRSQAEMLEGTLWDLLVEPDAQQLQHRLAVGERQPEEAVLLNFVDRDQGPFTLQCRVDVQPTGLIILGEEPAIAAQEVQTELMQISNELSVLNREHQRQNRELTETKERLERTLEDLNTSHWHLRKIQECLPVCAYCKKVKFGGAEAEWTDLLDFLTDHSKFLSHGLCPECFERQMAILEKESEGNLR